MNRIPVCTAIAVFGFFASSSFSVAAPTVTMCTGKDGGNYSFVGGQIAMQAKGVLNIKNVSTDGSLASLKKMDDGDCDVAVVQSDAYNVYMKQNSQSSLNLERGRVLYQELVHFICNSDARLSKITELDPKKHTVLIDGLGSGSNVTWSSFVAADAKRYSPVPTQPLGGLRAANKVQEGSEATCMLSVVGLNSNAMKEIDNLAKTSAGKLVLVNAQDSDLPGIKDPQGKPVYTKAQIPGGTYPNMQRGTFSTSVNTIAVDAVFVANAKWIDKHDSEYNQTLKFLNAAMPAILKRVNPD